MTDARSNTLKAIALIAIALAIAAMGIYVASADDPSLSGLGPAGIGMLLMAVAVVLGIKARPNRLPTWAARTVLGVGVLTAVVAAVLIHVVALARPLFQQPRAVPSVVDSAPSSQYAAAVDRARELVRTAVLEQNLAGLSVAVGAGLPSGALAQRAARSCGRKDSAGGTSTRERPSRRTPDSTSVRRRAWSLPPWLRGSG